MSVDFGITMERREHAVGPRDKIHLYEQNGEWIVDLRRYYDDNRERFEQAVCAAATWCAARIEGERSGR